MRITFPKRKIAQYDLKGNLIKVWNDFDEIYIELGFFASNIRNCIKGDISKAYGYRWMYKFE